MFTVGANFQILRQPCDTNHLSHHQPRHSHPTTPTTTHTTSHWSIATTHPLGPLQNSLSLSLSPITKHPPLPLLNLSLRSHLLASLTLYLQHTHLTSPNQQLPLPYLLTSSRFHSLSNHHVCLSVCLPLQLAHVLHSSTCLLSLSLSLSLYLCQLHDRVLCIHCATLTLPLLTLRPAWLTASSIIDDAIASVVVCHCCGIYHHCALCTDSLTHSYRACVPSFAWPAWIRPAWLGSHYYLYHISYVYTLSSLDPLLHHLIFTWLNLSNWPLRLSQVDP